MIPYLILDAGPIVAYLSQHDPFHDWVEQQLGIPFSGFLTCDAVLTEVVHFMMKSQRGISSLIDFIEDSKLQFPFIYAQNKPEIHTLLRKYSDVPMSFADACLVQLSELYPDAPILTLDSDFLIYRRNKMEPLPLILPKGRTR